ncbi:MAG: hypothetical protein K2X56_21345 [Mycobacterium pseudokansasii]|uniref:TRANSMEMBRANE PROTEIN n=1 Tax=Mycobacterium pseudokansasii TaxID=2341080 RepID=A0A498QQN9_9MYCO|nr:hypothetical protein A4G27_16985 [Mycobacterium kansasii]MBY0390566.1 hypothetical protein [Mycobacterium pseudokansasii]VAZ89053.1 hypothetical protein LAUMK35_00795 [Mycobacterium pseudokansasii]VAZ89677.1 hypothetical protein LAUMK21_00793 [Mycobacterium pseudokansasii]VBA47216.1 hypothetical protein LAUMK142_00656 [Mycobacterium pseudokansasii]
MADKEVDQDHVSDPGTAPFVPDFDTGSEPLPVLAAEAEKADSATQLREEPESPSSTPTVAEAHTDTSTGEPAAAPVQVPGRYQYLKWWKLLLVILGVWFGAAEVGLSLFYWWYHTLDKTAAVFVVLVYVVACAVGGLILSMVQGRPMIAALSIGVMSGPFASVAAAAPLYGYYYCERVGHCLVGVIPY